MWSIRLDSYFKLNNHHNSKNITIKIKRSILKLTLKLIV